jgi:6-methylpretetramide 4-monooxygenase / 4-hydroxy-6-methylpretetramide 12a-monooxygenase
MLNRAVRDGPVEVLVVGAGPSGLFAAAELARHGVITRIVEREPRPHRQARATVIQPGTLEILVRAETLDPFLARSIHLDYARVFNDQLEVVGEIAFAGAGCPCEFQCSLPQYRTEEILTDRLTELGGKVERGVSASSMDTTADDVVVNLEHVDGSEETAHVQWVIGAGGAHSITRESLDETLLGETYPGTALAADVRVSCGLPRDGTALIASPEGYILLGPLPDDRWITFIGDLHPDEAERLNQDASVEAVAASIERRAGDRVRLEDIAWASPFHMHRRLVSRLAGERRFLLGDAGHLSSPFGGEGLNSGLQDAHNLAWKLALVLQGRGRPVLLDSFASERLSADAHVLEVSDHIHQMAHGAVQAARTGVRPDPPTPEQVAAVVQSRSMLDVSYAGSPLVGEYVAPDADLPPGPGPGERYPDRAGLSGTGHHVLFFGDADEEALDRLQDRWDGLLEVVRSNGDPAHGGVRDGGAVLVRPDGHIGFRASSADAAGLSALDSHLESYLIPA